MGQIKTTDVAVVGAGLSGLSCAMRLARSGLHVQVLEAADGPGGRVGTDTVDGFLLDRGFQVLLTSYREAASVLDFDRLELGRFTPGAMIRSGGAFHKLADPRRRPSLALQTAMAPVGDWRDKLRLLRTHCKRPTSAEVAVTAEQYLDQCGFSAGMIQKFLRPFFAGVFLEIRLQTSSLKLEFVMGKFASGDAALPAGGMQAIADQLAAHVPAEAFRYRTRVTRVREGVVTLQDGEEVEARHIVLAVPRPEAVELIGGVEPGRACSTVCLYYDAPEPPVSGPWLVLNGEGTGLVNHLCVVSEVCPSYAPSGRSLVSVNIVGNPDLDNATLGVRVREELTVWFGPVVQAWRHLRTYRIPYALPLQGPADIDPTQPPPHISDRLLVCGDYTQLASIEGALISGRLAADAILSSSRK